MQPLRLHKCERCNALVTLNKRRCSPCQGDILAELHRAREKKARLARRAAKEHAKMAEERTI